MSDTLSSVSWLALGDSYTIGEGVPSEGRWPSQVAQQLRFAPPQYLAQTGWTTVDLREAVASADLAHRYDWVSIQIGVNDQYDGLGQQLYQEGLETLIDFALSRVEAPRSVLVVSIPDYSVTPFAQSREPLRIAQEVAAFNAIAQDVALSKRTTYCDITPASQRASDDITLLADDGLHPSTKMYQRWALQIAHQIS